MNPWHGRRIEWSVSHPAGVYDEGTRPYPAVSDLFVADFHPGEILMMKVARERGATRHELEILHLLKAELDATIIDAEAGR
jgi:hypothetical protein